MKNSLIISSMILILIFTISIAAQTENYRSNCKIGVVDGEVFSDENRGIKIVIKAKELLFIHSFKGDLIREIGELEKQTDSLLAQDKPINETYIKLQKLKTELKQLNERLQIEADRRYSLFVAPIWEKIKQKMQEFSKQKGYAVVIDTGDKSAILQGEMVDVTKEFIQFCNDSFDKEKLQKN